MQPCCSHAHSRLGLTPHHLALVQKFHGLPGYAGTRHAKTYTMTVPDGTYSLSDLEEYIARELYEKTNTRGTIRKPARNPSQPPPHHVFLPTANLGTASRRRARRCAALVGARVRVRDSRRRARDGTQRGMQLVSTGRGSAARAPPSP